MPASQISGESTTDVAACIADIERRMGSAPSYGLRLDVHVDPGLPGLDCEPHALQAAILHLLFNARDAMTGGGRIRLRAEQAMPADPVAIRIEDTGTGMSPDTLARAFDPSFTTKCEGLGGFGLVIVERFVSEAGGAVTIESKPGIGTIATLRLPPAKHTKRE